MPHITGFPSFMRLLWGWIISHCIYIPHFLHSSTDRHIGYFSILIIVTSAAMHVRVLILLQGPEFNSFGSIPRSGISQLYGSSILTILKNLHTVFHTGCTILYSHQESTMVPILRILANTCLFFHNSHPNRCEVISHSGFICFSLMTTMLIIFSYICWPLVWVFFFLRNVYSSPLSIF